MANSFMANSLIAPVAITLALMIGGTAPAFANAAAYHAKLVDEIEQEKIMAAGVRWTCDDDICEAFSMDSDNVMGKCQAFVAEVGPVRQFSMRRVEFSHEELKTCNGE